MDVDKPEYCPKCLGHKLKKLLTGQYIGYICAKCTEKSAEFPEAFIVYTQADPLVAFISKNIEWCGFSDEEIFNSNTKIVKIVVDGDNITLINTTELGEWLTCPKTDLQSAESFISNAVDYYHRKLNNG